MQPESMASKARQSASSVAERIAAPLQPGTPPLSSNQNTKRDADKTGDTTPTTRRMSDTPSTSRVHGKGSGVDVGEGWSDVQAQRQEDKGMMQSAQEMVAKALGGGSRGLFPFSRNQGWL